MERLGPARFQNHAQHWGLLLALVLLLLVACSLGEGGHRLAQVGPGWPISPASFASPVGPVAVGLLTIWLHAVATSGFLSEAAGPRLSPLLPGFRPSPHLGIFPPSVTYCPSILWVPEQLLCLQSDIWGSHRPWLLGPALPLLVRTKDLGRSQWRRPEPLSLPFLSLFTFFFLNLLAVGQCFWEWAPLQWMPYLH